MSNASRRAAEQMSREGISKLPRWSKPRRGVGCSLQAKLTLPHCEAPSCSKRAGYQTPTGNFCFSHPIERTQSKDTPQ